ncbi:MAG: hypothetical protein LBE24_00005 [Methylobacillus sp.]|jgi:hypothetical protein|nr:hypothetical protein [Methylobacillus sp.]
MKSFIVSMMALTSLLMVNANASPNEIEEIQQDIASSAFDPLWGTPSQTEMALVQAKTALAQAAAMCGTRLSIEQAQIDQITG